MNSTLLQTAVEKVLGKEPQLYGFHHMGGGEINQLYKVITDKGVYFAKVHDLERYPKFFDKEMFSLSTIQKTNTIEVCKPIGICECEGMEFFFIEYVESGPPSETYWNDMGQKLANLHMHSNRYFGFVEDNYLGITPQINHRNSNWGQFFIKNRLMPNVRKAAENMYLDLELVKKFEKYYQLVEVVFPEETPSLLHGNLWKEQILVTQEGSPILCNPSAYFGHREMDIAMTKMVGSFPVSFYESYNATYPLIEDWEIRIGFCQMYYSLVNLNNYGMPYLPSVEDKLNKWVK
jgi:fructosamine-3-kinase